MFQRIFTFQSEHVHMFESAIFIDFLKTCNVLDSKEVKVTLIH
jgi:hypothetical protein